MESVNPRGKALEEAQGPNRKRAEVVPEEAARKAVEEEYAVYLDSYFNRESLVSDSFKEPQSRADYKDDE